MSLWELAVIAIVCGLAGGFIVLGIASLARRIRERIRS